MLIPCKQIAADLEQDLKLRVQAYAVKNKRIKLVTFLFGNSPEQLSFVTIKKRIAERLGVVFDFIHYPTVPPFKTFASILEEVAQDSATTGILLQLPLPAKFDTQALYDLIPPAKDIEGHKPESAFQFPLSLAVLAGIKYIYSKNGIVDFHKDASFFKKNLADKKIVIVGRGQTGGKPIADALTKLKVPFIQTNSETTKAEKLYKDADIIITATGKRIITKKMVKPGVVLLNVGLRKEKGKLKGDYNEAEIKDTASWYTETPGGLGPLDVLYLFKNVIDSATKTIK